MPACWQAWSTVVPGGTSTWIPSMVSLGMTPVLGGAPRGGVAVFLDAALHLRAEMADQALHGPCRGIAQRADGVAFDHALHHPPHPTRAFAARRALAAALVLVEFREARDGADDVGRFVHDDDRGRAEAALHVAQRVEIHQHAVADRFRDDRHRRAAGDDAQQVVPAAAHAAGMRLEQFLQGNAHRLLDIAGALDMAGEAEDLGALVLRPADAREPGGAAPQDGRRHGDGLDIVHRRWAAIEPDRRRERRLQARLALLALEALEQRRLLAADIGAGAAMEIELEIVARATGVLADETGGIGLVDRRPEGLRLVVELAADIDVADMHAHADAGEETAFDELVRIMADDVAVLAGAGLGLVGVDDEIGRPRALLRHEGPFDAGREAGAAAAAQAGILHLGGDPVAALEDEVLGAVPVAARAGTGQPPVMQAIEVGENPVLVAEHYGFGPAKERSFSVRGPPSGAEVWRWRAEPGGGFSPRRRASISPSVAGPSRSS